MKAILHLTCDAIHNLIPKFWSSSDCRETSTVLFLYLGCAFPFSLNVSRRFKHTSLSTMFFSFISNNLNYLLSDSRLNVFWSNNFYCPNVQSLSSSLSKRKKILEKKHVYFQTFVCHFSSEVFVSSEVTCYEKFPLLMLYLVVSACLLRYPWNATSNACPEIHFFFYNLKKRIKV